MPRTKRTFSPEQTARHSKDQREFIKAAGTLQTLGLNPVILSMIGKGNIEWRVEQAQRKLDALNEALDAWEIANPAAAALAPWAETRAAWKAAGRPAPPWWKLIEWFYPQKRTPLRSESIDEALGLFDKQARYRRRKAAVQRAEKAALSPDRLRDRQ